MRRVWLDTCRRVDGSMVWVDGSVALAGTINYLPYPRRSEKMSSLERWRTPWWGMMTPNQWWGRGVNVLTAYCVSK